MNTPLQNVYAIQMKQHGLDEFAKIIWQTELMLNLSKT